MTNDQSVRTRQIKELETSGMCSSPTGDQIVRCWCVCVLASLAPLCRLCSRHGTAIGSACHGDTTTHQHMLTSSHTLIYAVVCCTPVYWRVTTSIDTSVDSSVSVSYSTIIHCTYFQIHCPCPCTDILLAIQCQHRALYKFHMSIINFRVVPKLPYQ